MCTSRVASSRVDSFLRDVAVVSLALGSACFTAGVCGGGGHTSAYSAFVQGAAAVVVAAVVAAVVVQVCPAASSASLYTRVLVSI